MDPRANINPTLRKGYSQFYHFILGHLHVPGHAQVLVKYYLHCAVKLVMFGGAALLTLLIAIGTFS